MLHLIKNARVFAPDDIGICNLLIAAGKIAWLGEAVPELAGISLTTTDLEGKRLLPGFIDCHVHVTGGGGESGFASRVPPLALSQFTSAGVTSVVGVLGTDDTTRDTSALLAQVRSLREEGLGAWCHAGGYHVPAVTFTGCIRKDIVNLDAVIGVGELAISDHRSSQPSLQELIRIASDAHVAGLMTAKAGIVHLHLGDGERGLELVRQALDTTELPARVFNPTHVNRRKALFEESLDLANRGCVVDITASPVVEGDDAWSADQALLRYFDCGAPQSNVSVSSDGGGCLPVFNDQCEVIHMDIGQSHSLVTTLGKLLSAGVKLEKILPAFTSNVARLLRLHDRGRIGEDMVADLVTLDDDNRICDVMVSGQWHVYAGKQIIYGQYEKPQSEQDD